MIPRGLLKVIDNCIKVDLWAPMGVTFRIGLVSCEVNFSMHFDWQKVSPAKVNKMRKEVSGDDRDQTEGAEPRPRKGEGGGKPPPPLGSEG